MNALVFLSQTCLLSLKFRSPFFGVKSPTARISSQGTVVFAAPLFTSEILRDSPGDSPTYSKQSVANQLCCLETQNARWFHAKWYLLEFVYGLLLGNCRYQTNLKKDLWPKWNHPLLITLLAILLCDKIVNLLCSVTITFVLFCCCRGRSNMAIYTGRESGWCSSCGSSCWIFAVAKVWFLQHFHNKVWKNNKNPNNKNLNSWI